MPIIYRPCERKDIDDILRLWSIGAPGGSTNTTAALTLRLERDQALFQLAWDSDMLVGSLIGAWDGWRANMYRLAVHPKYRRRGIGTALVRKVERLLGELGATRVYALAMFSNSEAVPFWNRLGYEANAALEPLVKSLK